ncbi:hypothetical protein [Alkalibacterium olivapovliticus]|uniref:Uncharacterized protein n=1 Tax=Alkalibacterium olivapovliticus TaxID=99907 RepID=A0A2T0W6B3_9LACT|nr:hypothetical protein [Alkalibacterium olivapovliticus]PRY82235.1 hypothetical protein CLV38_11431 [Alkalibacterium olivapovliticus]
MQNGPVQSGSQFMPIDIAKDIKEEDNSTEENKKAKEAATEDEKPFNLDKVDDLENTKQEKKNND